MIAEGSSDSQISLWIWIDTNSPVAHAEIVGEKKFNIQVKLEIWGNTDHKLQDLSPGDMHGHLAVPPKSLNIKNV